MLPLSSKHRLASNEIDENSAYNQTVTNYTRNLLQS